jgi:hypothetical protein
MPVVQSMRRIPLVSKLQGLSRQGPGLCSSLFHPRLVPALSKCPKLSHRCQGVRYRLRPAIRLTPRLARQRSRKQRDTGSSQRAGELSCETESITSRRVVVPCRAGLPAQAVRNQFLVPHQVVGPGHGTRPPVLRQREVRRSQDYSWRAEASLLLLLSFSIRSDMTSLARLRLLTRISLLYNFAYGAPSSCPSTRYSLCGLQIYIFFYSFSLFFGDSFSFPIIGSFSFARQRSVHSAVLSSSSSDSAYHNPRYHHLAFGGF